jgi:tRNA (adenine57-N1/adenine58-N1)-methyltransferase
MPPDEPPLMPAAELREGDLVLLISPDKKRQIFVLEPGGLFHSHKGMVRHDDLIRRSPGTVVTSHSGEPFTAFRPSIEELLMSVKRSTQIVYPKDVGYLLLKLSIVPGRRVVEAGSGSGAFTCALATYVSPGGRVYSYESRAEMLALAEENVARLGLAGAVNFHHHDIASGFFERAVDAVFLDVREPWHFLRQAAEALCPGGFFGALVPTLNQVIALVSGLDRAPFADVEVAELLLRQYKPVPERTRPLDRLTAHTGFLATARYLPR